MKRTTRPHSDAVRRVVSVETSRLQKRCRVLADRHPGLMNMQNFPVAVAGVPPAMTDPEDSPGLSRVLDDLIPLEYCQRLLAEDLQKADWDLAGQFWGTMLDELVGYHTALIRQMATSLAAEPQEDVSQMLLEVTIQMGLSAVRSHRTASFDERDMLRHLASDLLKDDPAYRYMLTNGTVPFSVYRWLIEQRIPGTDSIVAVCSDYGSRWRMVQSKMEAARNKNIVDDYTWNTLFGDNDRIISEWKAAVTILAGRNPGR